jgi:hypothetical protein
MDFEEFKALHGKSVWNEFNKIHTEKGLPKDEIKTLYEQFKEGNYVLPHEEEQEEAAPVEEAPQPADPRKEFLSLFNELYILNDSGEIEKSLHGRLVNLAKKTRPEGYYATKADGWTLYLGPSQKAVVVNEPRQVAFTITRAYWHRFYQGAALVDTQMFNDEEGLERLKKQFRRRGSLVLRYPIPGVEIMVPHSSLDIPLPTGVL